LAKILPWEVKRFTQLATVAVNDGKFLSPRAILFVSNGKVGRHTRKSGNQGQLDCWWQIGKTQMTRDSVSNSQVPILAGIG
jgi:hypothetical protein